MSKEPEKTVTISYKKIVHETEKALLVKMPDDEDIWIPKSQIIAEDDTARAMEVTAWIAEQKELV